MASLFVDNLTVIDFSYLHPVRGVVGESWIVDVILHGDLNDEGMVFDFGHVKKQIKQWIDQSVDHCLLVPENHPSITVTYANDQTDIQLFDQSNALQVRVVGPKESIELIPSNKITAESVTPVLEQMIQQRLPSNVNGIELRLRPEDINGDYYHYTHGLKKHKGDCQRIAHGHRSRLEVYVDDERNTQLEQQWAKRWTDIYLISEEDIIDTDNNLIHSGYHSEQGRFDIWLPSDRCDTMQTDTTVELIAQHLANETAKLCPGQKITIRAFEGVQKGAIAYA